MESSQLILFIVTSLVLIAIPGPDMILVMSRSIAIGQKAGMATAAGVSVGLLGHTLLATLGLGAILQASEWLFTILKLAGAAYLLYLGVRSFYAPLLTMQTVGTRKVPYRELFFQGAISNLSNPKIAIFYFAFLPQFVSAESSRPATMLLVLGVTFSVLTFLVKGPVAFLPADYRVGSEKTLQYSHGSIELVEWCWSVWPYDSYLKDGPDRLG